MSFKNHLRNLLEQSMYNEVVELTRNEQECIIDDVMSNIPKLVEERMMKYVWSNQIEE